MPKLIFAIRKEWRNMEEWIPIDEDVPLRSPHYKRCSEDVQIQLASGDEVIGFFVTDDEEWYYRDTARRIPFDQVVAWRSIEEVPD